MQRDGGTIDHLREEIDGSEVLFNSVRTWVLPEVVVGGQDRHIPASRLNNGVDSNFLVLSGRSVDSNTVTLVRVASFCDEGSLGAESSHLLLLSSDVRSSILWIYVGVEVRVRVDSNKVDTGLSTQFRASNVGGRWLRGGDWASVACSLQLGSNTGNLGDQIRNRTVASKNSFVTDGDKLEQIPTVLASPVDQIGNVQVNGVHTSRRDPETLVDLHSH